MGDRFGRSNAKKVMIGSSSGIVLVKMQHAIGEKASYIFPTVQPLLECEVNGQ